MEHKISLNKRGFMDIRYTDTATVASDIKKHFCLP